MFKKRNWNKHNMNKKFKFKKFSQHCMFCSAYNRKWNSNIVILNYRNSISSYIKEAICCSDCFETETGIVLNDYYQVF